MRLSKFIKTTVACMSFASLVSSYGDKQVVWLWEVEKAKQLTEKGESFVYYIQDIHTLMYFLESSDKYTDATYKISKDCLLNALENPIAINVISTMELDTINLVKVKEVTSALQKIISQKTNDLPYIGIPEWNEIVMPCGEFYYITESGYPVPVDPKSEEIKKKGTAFRSFLPLGSKKTPYVSNDRLMFHEIDQAACKAKTGDLLERLSKADKTDDVASIFAEFYGVDAELNEMLKAERRGVQYKSQPSSGVPSRTTSPESQE